MNDAGDSSGAPGQPPSAAGHRVREAALGGQGPVGPDTGPSGQPGSTGRAPDNLTIEIMHEAGEWDAFGDVDAALAAVAAVVGDCDRLGLRAAEAAIVLADDATVQTLNRSWRSIDKPTNVLSFPSGQPASIVESTGTRMLGDVVLACQTLVREAEAQAKAPVHHLQHLALHGLLHLAGFDHESEAEAEDMEQLEVELLARLGVANPYEDEIKEDKVSLRKAAAVPVGKKE